MTDKEILELYQTLEEQGSDILISNLLQNIHHHLELYQKMNLFLPLTTLSMRCLNILIISNFLVQLKHDYSKIKNYAITNHIFYQEILQKYKQCNIRIMEALEKIPTHHPICIAGAYSYLLERGFFSAHHFFQLENNPQDINLGIQNPGIEIISGRGVCRNIACHLDDLLTEMNFCTSPILVSVNRDTLKSSSTSQLTGIKDFYTLSYEKEILSQENQVNNYLFQKINYLLGNHLINGISYQNKAYWIDITNSLCYQKKDDTHLIPYHTCNQNHSIYIHSLINPQEYHINLEQIKDFLKKDNSSFEEIKEEYYLGQKYASKNSTLFEQVYQTNRETYSEIVMQLRQLEITKEHYKKLTKQK